MRRINLQVQGGGGRRSGATLTDDNAAIANLDKQKYKLFCESSLINNYPSIKHFHPSAVL